MICIMTNYKEAAQFFNIPFLPTDIMPGSPQLISDNKESTAHTRHRDRAGYDASGIWPNLFPPTPIVKPTIIDYAPPYPPISLIMTSPIIEPKVTPVVKAPELLIEAADTLKERATQRDATAQGERSMKRTVDAFNALTGKNLTEAEGWEFMVLLKLVRGRQGAFRKDDYVDGAAYCALLGECESKAVKQ